MKKEALMKSFLVLLPVLAVGLATTVNSVTIYDAASGITTYSSYFTRLDIGEYAQVTPLAGLLCAVAGILAAIFLISKKETWLICVRWISLGAALAAVLPILLRGEILVIPNVGVPLLMLAQWLLSSYMLRGKKEELVALQSQKKSGSGKKRKKKK